MGLWAHSIASVTRMKNVSADLNSFIIDIQIMFCKLPAEPERASPLLNAVNMYLFYNTSLLLPLHTSVM